MKVPDVYERNSQLKSPKLRGVGNSGVWGNAKRILMEFVMEI